MPTPEQPGNEEMRDEYDLDGMRTKGRGVYTARYSEGTNVRLLKPHLAELFRDDKAVNDALEDYLRMKRDTN